MLPRYFYIQLAKFTSLKQTEMQSVYSLLSIWRVFGNFVIIIIMLCSFMSRMRCYVLSILLSSPSGTVFLYRCCLWLTIPHQTTLHENSSPRRRQQQNKNIATRLNTGVMKVFSLTLHDKISPRLLKLYFSIVALVKGAKWFIIMLNEQVRQCTNGVGSNPTEGRTQFRQLQI